MWWFLTVVIQAGLTFSTPIRRGDPSVTIQNGTVIGVADGGVDSFYGIPFAVPPVGQNRLRRPEPIGNFGTFKAQTGAMACPQFFAQSNSPNIVNTVLSQILDSQFGRSILNYSEDCLTVNVQKPSTATPASKLPVVVWFFGGGFELGSTSMYDGARIVQMSMSLKKDIVFVAVNYRVAAWGFLGGKELQAEGNTNLGLHDQRLGLMWVQENIEAFGGDPAKVTIWGESAGSISVFNHLIIEGGNNLYKGKPMFRAAIMNSGSAVPTQPVNSTKPQTVFDTIVREAGCEKAMADKLDCLRSIDFDTMLKASSAVPGIFSYQSLDLSYLPRPDPMSSFYPISPELAVNLDIRLPIIIGDQADEGTLFAFSQSNVTTTEDMVEYFQTYFTETTRDIVAGLVATYPDDPAAGSPYGTGTQYNIYPQYKRMAAILGDAVFIMPRRVLLALFSQKMPMWSYMSTFFSGLPQLGTAHGTDLLPIYFNFGIQTNPVVSFLTYYISFINDMDPNTSNKAKGLIDWPQWSPDTRTLLNLQSHENKLITDDFREQSFQYFVQHSSDLRA